MLNHTHSVKDGIGAVILISRFTIVGSLEDSVRLDELILGNSSVALSVFPVIGQVLLGLAIGPIQVGNHEPLRTSQTKVFYTTIKRAPHESSDIVYQESQAAAEFFGNIFLLFCFHEYNILGNLKQY